MDRFQAIQYAVIPNYKIKFAITFYTAIPRPRVSTHLEELTSLS